MVKEMWFDYGESSLTIVSTLLNINKLNPSIPRDPSDFRRCIHLFKCLGYDKYAVNSVLRKVAKQYPIWGIIEKNWDRLIKLYQEEKNNISAPKLYTLLQELNLKNCKV